jgi:GNAT superfamily N-acetyltransferase
MAPLIRPMHAGDLEAVDRVLAANDEGVVAPDGSWPYLELLLDHGRALVAEVGGVVVGFAATVPAGRLTHLSDLFVDPASQSGGVGGALLDAALAGPGPFTTSSSADPRALALYVRHGLRAVWPACYVVGEAEGLPAVDPALEVTPVAPAAMSAAELALTGVDRGPLHAYEARETGSVHLELRVGGTLVAAGHARDARKGSGRWLDRLVLGPAADPVPAVVAALRAASAPGGSVGTCVPGPHPALPVLLEAGFRMIDRDTFCESEPGLVDPTRPLVDPSLL